MNRSQNVDSTQFRDFLYWKAATLLVLGPMLLVAVGCNIDPEATDLGRVHATEQSAVRALYDGIASFTTNDDGHVVAIEYDSVNLDFANRDLASLAFDDADMAEIAKLSKLKRLDLPMINEISDQGMKDLASLSELEVLMAYGLPNVTSEGFQRLASLQNLKGLGLGLTGIDDAGLEHLSKLHELEFLDLTMAKISDEGARHLQHLEKLKSLALVSTSISDASLDTISQLSDLEELDVRGCDITDDGLAALAKLPRLRRLVAFPTPRGGGHITDKGLEHLEGIKTLEYVNLANNPVSEAGAASLRAALPNCEVEIKDTSKVDAS